MTTKRLFTTICTLALTLSTAWAQGPNGSKNYYQDADGKKGAALKTALCKKIYSRTEVLYDDIWSAFETTDLRSDGKIWDMYSNITNYRYITDQAGNYQKEGDKYNREHSFPKSWFGGKESSVPGHDLFHIYPTDGFVNGKRSNYPFGENNGEEYSSSGNFSKLGKCTYPGCTYIGDKEYVFEPNDKYKGDFARTYFYMVTCYEEQLSTWYKNYANSNEGLKATIDGSTYPAFTTWQLNMLLDWSRNDPVSEKEINRNNAVYDLQKNRNPFIDYPGLEDYIWGDKKDVAFSYDHYEGSSTGKQPVTMSFMPTSVTATLGESFTAPTLSMSPSGLTVTYSSSNTNVATVNASTGAVTLKAVGVTIITATFAGNDEYYANSTTYTLTVKQQGGDDPTPSGETLLWESFSGYKGTTDTSNAITPSDENLDYDGWASLTKVFFGANGTGKLSSGSGNGSMVTKTIALTGNGVLTFKLKKYGTDASSLSLSVSGATADVTKITAEADWVDHVVNISDANGGITLTFNATKRLYIDDIKLVSVAEEPTTTPGDIVKDGNIDWSDLKALVKILLGITPAEGNIDENAADVNEDGKTNIADVTRLVNMLLQ